MHPYPLLNINGKSNYDHACCARGRFSSMICIVGTLEWQDRNVFLRLLHFMGIAPLLIMYNACCPTEFWPISGDSALSVDRDNFFVSVCGSLSAACHDELQKSPPAAE